MPWMPGCPADPATPKGSLEPIAIVLHRTYGQWSGDYSVGKNDGLFQFLIGQQDGQWVQFMDTNSVAWHCNGANFKAFGIELTGTNEDPLTEWQVARLGDVLRWASQVHGIPLNYQDPLGTPAASIHVNDGGFRGVIAHISVQTDDGSQQHTDYVTTADYQRVINPQPEEEADMWSAIIVGLDGVPISYAVAGSTILFQDDPKGPRGAYNIPQAAIDRGHCERLDNKQSIDGNGTAFDRLKRASDASVLTGGGAFPENIVIPGPIYGKLSA